MEWFEAAVHPGTVRTVLAREIREFASGEMTLLGVEVKRLRSAEPDGHWTATYVLTVEAPGVPRRAMQMRGLLVPPGAAAPDAATSVAPFGADGWQSFVEELRLELSAVATDAALRGLALLTDPDEARTLLERLLRDSDPALDAIRLSEVTPQIMDHKLGVRCTVLCHLEYPPDARPDERGPHMVVAKVSLAEEAARTHAAMQSLWESPLSRSEHVTIARPLAYVPELGLVVQSAVPEERTLKDLLQSALVSEAREEMTALDDALRTTAGGLADLHRCGARHGETVTWSEELATLRAKQAKLAGVVPRMADLGAVLDRLQAAATTTPADPFVPVHHSFRPAQVLLADGRISFIDFDKSCQGEPASDLAMFTTKLRHASLNKLHAAADDEDDDEVLDLATRGERIHRADAMCDTFVAEYSRHASVTPGRLALWEALELFSLILSAAKKVRTGRIENCVFMLEEHMHRSGLTSRAAM